MPLIIITGFPCSGKTTVAEALEKYFFEVKQIKCSIVSEHNCKYVKNELFTDVQKEKEIRAHLKSDVQRILNKDTLVIFDAGNYIKGYRYELYCLAKSSKTTNCVLHCDINSHVAWERNCARNEEDIYEKAVFEELIQRYEEPDSRNRWDSPLFIIQANESPPLDDIYEVLYCKKALRPNRSTQPVPVGSTNFLYDLDKKTQQTVNEILEAQKTAAFGDDIILPGCSEKFSLKRAVTVGEIARLRRQFITYSKMHPVDDTNVISNMFVQYLNTSIS